MSQATINSVAPASTTAALAGAIPKETSQVEEGGFSSAVISSVAPESTTASLAAAVPKETSGGINGAVISSAAPESTTASLAGAVPKETATNGAAISSAAPESSTAALAGAVPLVNTPGASDLPGGFPETPALEKNELKIKAPEEEEQQTFSVNPLPASDTAENPITLAPGEPVPAQIGTQSIHSNVKLDKESYESGATNFPISSFILPEVVTPAEQRAAEGRGVLDLPVITPNLIPESSLPIVSASEAAAAKPTDIPDIVKESQEKSHTQAEASGSSEAVELKAEVEQELKREVPEEPSTSEGNTLTTQVVQAAGEVAQKAQAVTVEAATEVTAAVTGVVAATGIAAYGISGRSAAVEEPSTLLPEVVRESIVEDGHAPEAAAVDATVEAKEQVEAELKHEIAETPAVATSSPAPGPIAQENAAKISTQKAPVVTDGVTDIEIPAISKPTEKATEKAADKSEEADAGIVSESASEIITTDYKDALEQQEEEDARAFEEARADQNATNGHKAASATSTVSTTPSVPTPTAKEPASPASTTSSSKKHHHKRRSLFEVIKEKFHFGASPDKSI